jgi:hypothetical protein
LVGGFSPASRSHHGLQRRKQICPKLLLPSLDEASRSRLVCTIKVSTNAQPAARTLHPRPYHDPNIEAEDHRLSSPSTRFPRANLVSSDVRAVRGLIPFSNQAGLNPHWHGSWALVKGKSRGLRRWRHLQLRLRNSPKAGRFELVDGVLAWVHAETVTLGVSTKRQGKGPL